jgi:hypothetical protein
MSARPDPSSFLSGDAGDVSDPWRVAKRRAGELAYRALDLVSATGRRTARLADRTRRLEVLVLGIYRPGSLLPDALPALRSAHHRVSLAFGSTATEPDPELAGVTAATGLGGGKFENLNALLAAAPERRAEWMLVVDDDVALPPSFLDRFLAICEVFALDLAQPAQTLMSHSAWKVTRRRPAALARLTRFVEIGPVTAFRRGPAAELLPFPELRFGWGLDLHWAALAAERGWRVGVVDAVPVRHEARTIASGYPRREAEEEAARFLSERPYLPSERAGDTVAVYRRMPG